MQAPTKLLPRRIVFSLAFAMALSIPLSLVSGQALRENHLSELPAMLRPAQDEHITYTGHYVNGHYVNERYGYSVDIPPGDVGLSDRPPAPNHGFVVQLSNDPERLIVIDGSYNAPGLVSLDAFARFKLDSLKQRGATDCETLLIEATFLGDKIPALHLRVAYTISGEGMLYDGFLAIRKEHHKDQVLYEVGLSTPEADYSVDKTSLGDLVAGWRLEPLP